MIDLLDVICDSILFEKVFSNFFFEVISKKKVEHSSKKTNIFFILKNFEDLYFFDKNSKKNRAEKLI